ncbi:hypothetical protein CTRI78_v003123 [Colletotrichum trifolii]|uniref:Uncharacterized protein n=1 Tax=Colletotrichum trifolii TaxID=5466 RepID=A0A4V3HWU6_COLTR|nr:hypothetical protein CTRI78_v003123 [Colletotrichum trifolii]
MLSSSFSTPGSIFELTARFPPARQAHDPMTTRDELSPSDSCLFRASTLLRLSPPATRFRPPEAAAIFLLLNGGRGRLHPACIRCSELLVALRSPVTPASAGMA